MRPAAGTKIQIPVRQEHIDFGQPSAACGCAVARAIADAVPESTDVSVCYADDGMAAEARVWLMPGSWLRLTLGADAYQFMYEFDNERPVQPTTLMAEVA
jgi:hypothetical protein